MPRSVIPEKKLRSSVVQGNNATLLFNSVCHIVGATFGDNYTPFSDLDLHRKELVKEWSKVAHKYVTYHQPDCELDNGKPRPVNRSAFNELSMLEHQSADLCKDLIMKCCGCFCRAYLYRRRS